VVITTEICRSASVDLAAEALGFAEEVITRGQPSKLCSNTRLTDIESGATGPKIKALIWPALGATMDQDDRTKRRAFQTL
jgi:hypothetical protein